MSAKGHPLLGKWRITGMEPWDAEFIDLLGPGYIRFDADGGGEFAFGAVQGGLDCHFGPTTPTSPGRAATRWTTPVAMATPNSKRMAPSPARSASTAATSHPSPPAAGSFSAAC